MLKGDRKFQHRMNCVAGFLLLFCFYALLFWHLSTGLCCFRVYNDSIVYSMDIYIYAKSISQLGKMSLGSYLMIFG